jgi:hypothetical protein
MTSTLPSPSNVVSLDGSLYEVPFKTVRHAAFKGERKRKPGHVVRSVILHQTVTSSRQRCESVLVAKGLGIQVIVDELGIVHTYGDLATSGYGHANERNDAIGIDIVNPYSVDKEPWGKRVKSRTAWKGMELEDTPTQIAAVCAVIKWLTEAKRGLVNFVDIKLTFPTTQLNEPSRGSPLWFDATVQGVIAHGHRPGIYPKFHKLAGQEVKGVHADARRSIWLVANKMNGV